MVEYTLSSSEPRAERRFPGHSLRALALVVAVALAGVSACARTAAQNALQGPAGNPAGQADGSATWEPLPYMSAAWLPLSYADTGRHGELTSHWQEGLEELASTLEQKLEWLGVERQHFTGGVEIYFVDQTLDEQTGRPVNTVMILSYQELELALLRRAHGATLQTSRGHVYFHQGFFAFASGNVDARTVNRIIQQRVSPAQPLEYLQFASRISPALILESQTTAKEVLEALLSDVGVDCEDMEALTEFLPEVRRMEALVRVARDIQSFDLAAALVNDHVEISMKITPTAGTGAATFLQNHEINSIDSLPYVPAHSDFAGFIAIESRVLQPWLDFYVQEHNQSLPYSVRERRFIEDTNSKMAAQKGALTTFALYQDASNHTTFVQFFESEQPENSIRSWIDLLALSIARDDAVSAARSREYSSSRFSRLYLPSTIGWGQLSALAAKGLGTIRSWARVYRTRIQRRKSWTVELKELEDGEYRVVSMSVGAGERGVVTAVGENSLVELERLFVGAHESTSGDAFGRHIESVQKPVFGMSVDYARYLSHRAELKRLIPFARLFIHAVDTDAFAEPSRPERIKQLTGLPPATAIGWINGGALRIKITVPAEYMKRTPASQGHPKSLLKETGHPT